MASSEHTMEAINKYLMEEVNQAVDHLGVLPCQGREGGLYPNLDLAVWMRSCTKEVDVPVEGKVSGLVPSWLNGTLLQNGPGKFYFGQQDVFKHLFDGSALIQKYEVKDGRVYYQCKYLRTRSFQKNVEAKAIAVSEFGTNGGRALKGKGGRKRLLNGWMSVASAAVSGNLDDLFTDNAMISVYPFGPPTSGPGGLHLYCFFESPFIHRLDLATLATLERVDLCKAMGVLSHSSHPHFDPGSGDMLSLGMALGPLGPKYLINRIPATGASDHKGFQRHQVVGVAKSRWALSPCYMHSFAVTENFFVLVEQPMSVNMVALMGTMVSDEKALIDALSWKQDSPTIFHLIPRDPNNPKVTRQVSKVKYQSEAFFFLHIINAFEDKDHIVLDISCYKTPHMLHCMKMDRLATVQSDPDYANLFRGRPQRYTLPLKLDASKGALENQVTLKGHGSQGKAFLVTKDLVHLAPWLLCQVGCETPTIYYSRFNGRKYRYFYAITSDVDHEYPGTLYKVDTLTGEAKSWQEENTYCAEPQFIPRPRPGRGAADDRDDGTDDEEDDGVLVASMIRGHPDVHYTGLIVLDAKDLTELARAEFQLESPVPKPLHGCFVPTV